MPTHYAVQLDAQKLDLPALLQNDIVPSLSPAAMLEKGVALGDKGAHHSGLLALIELPNGSASTQYVPAPTTSTPSPATTGAATTPWR